MDKVRTVLVVDEVHPLLFQRLSAVEGIEVEYVPESSPEQVVERLNASVRPVFGLVLRSKLSLNADVLSRSPGLRFIARAGSGTDGIDVEFAKARNITCIHASEGNRLAVAEHVLGMILAWKNRLVRGDLSVREGRWDREGHRGLELAGTVVGLLGYGNNGSQTARLLVAMGCQVLVYDRYKSGFATVWHANHPAWTKALAPLSWQHDAVGALWECSLQDLQAHAQILSLHLPLMPETKGWINRDFLGACPNLHLLVNAARGPLVHLPDLLAALDQGALQGACLDTLPVEDPHVWDVPTMNRLFAKPSVLLTPHVGGWTHESYLRISEVLADKIMLYLQEHDRP
jgi:D-3-phosphoglycerate dehydrogenase